MNKHKEELNTDILPIRIVKMVAALHKKGFHDIYLFSGLSPSGMNWRFNIGKIIDESWPGNSLIKGSITNEGVLEWSSENASVEKLTEDFQNFYELKKPTENKILLDYVFWYSGILDSFVDDEYLILYADFEAHHKHFLKNAPGYNGKII